MQTFRIERHGNVPLRFDGEEIGFASSDDGNKARWAEITIYRTDKGRYVLCQVGRSRNPNERSDIGHVNICDTAEQVRLKLERTNAEGRGYYTNVALDALEAAADNDVAFLDVLEEKI